MPRLEAGQRRGTRIPSKVSGIPIYQKGSGGTQKPFSWLSEGVSGIFTIHTEAGEIACVLHLKIPNVPTRGRDTLKREVRKEQEMNMDTLLYGPMEGMRRK